jgi:NADPH:quinone reductase-like Zn-dependent oxidoreductase
VTVPSVTMRALVLDEFGSELVLRDIRRPEPGRGEVLVRIDASGVNPLDTKIRSGPPRTQRSSRRPSSESTSQG